MALETENETVPLSPVEQIPVRGETVGTRREAQLEEALAAQELEQREIQMEIQVKKWQKLHEEQVVPVAWVASQVQRIVPEAGSELAGQVARYPDGTEEQVLPLQMMADSVAQTENLPLVPRWIRVGGCF